MSLAHYCDVLESRKGVKKARKILTPDQKQEIIRLSKYLDGQSIADKYNIHKATVSKILSKANES